MISTITRRRRFIFVLLFLVVVVAAANLFLVASSSAKDETTTTTTSGDRDEVATDDDDLPPEPADDDDDVAATAKKSSNPRPANPRIITKDELATKNGKDSDELWLAILGEVYNVTAGAQYYKEGATYHVFVGRDGSAAFVTGNFTPEAAEAAVYTTLEPTQLSSLETWREFYQDEAKYPFLGLLEGELYDRNGQPTEEMMRVQVAITEGKRKLEEQKKKQAEVFERRRKEREEKKKKTLEEEGAASSSATKTTTTTTTTTTATKAADNKKDETIDEEL